MARAVIESWLGRSSVAVVATLTVLAAFAPSAIGLPLTFNAQLHQSGPRQTDYTTVDLARAASDIAPGAIIRFTVPWAGVQPYCRGPLGVQVQSRLTCNTPGPERWDWNRMETDLDSISTYLRSGRIRLLAVVAFAPAWAQGYGDLADPVANPPDMPPGADPVALQWWQDFNAALVSWLEGRYGPASLAGVEVWNEEDNYPVSWSLEPRDARLMATRYSQMLCSAHSGVRSVDRNLPVIFGGFNPFDTRYLKDAYSSPVANIRTCMTAIGIHPYVPNSDPPNTPGSAFAAGASAVERVASGERDGGRPIWITEFGYPIEAPLTAQEQGDWDAQAYGLAGALPNVRVMGIHSVFDQGPDGPAARFGVCAAPHSPRIAATELKQAVSGNPNATATC
jgi:hypothetical protein